MKYAKLIGGYPSYAPNPILVGDNWIGNPPGTVYLDAGYKPVVYADPPSDPPSGYSWSEVWAEEDGNIQQGWVLEEETEASADEAIEYLFGGES